MKLIAERDGYQLYYEPSRVNRYMLYFTPATSPSGGAVKLKQMVDQSPVFKKSMKSFFAEDQVRNALAIVHAVNFASKKYKC